MANFDPNWRTESTSGPILAFIENLVEDGLNRSRKSEAEEGSKPQRQQDFENTMRRHEEERKLIDVRLQRLSLYNTILFVAIQWPLAIALTGKVPAVGSVTHPYGTFIAGFMAVGFMFTFGIASLGVWREVCWAMQADGEIWQYWRTRSYSKDFPPTVGSPLRSKLTEFSIISCNTPLFIGVAWIAIGLVSAILLCLV